MSPSIVAVSLGLFSALTLAAANFAVKRGSDVLTARMVLSLSMALSVLPFVWVVEAPLIELWPIFIAPVLVHWAYQFCLIKALHRGDLSRVFPIMRGSAPMLVALAAAVVLGETLSWMGWMGLAMASLAVIVFALPEMPGLSLFEKAESRKASYWAVLTALGIAAYSVVDAHAIRQMPSAYTFIVYLFLLDWIGITIVALWTRRGELWPRIRPQLKAGMLGGLAGTLSYGSALYAFTLADTAFVTAMRETSVVWAALMGAYGLKEGFGTRRILAACGLATGLVLMQVFG